MKRNRILSIGRDLTIFNPGSPLTARFVEYDKTHTFTHIVMATGKANTIMIGQSTVTTLGGYTFVDAFFRALFSARAHARTTPHTLVTTQDVLYAGLAGYLISRWCNLPLYVQLHGDYLDNPKWFASKVGYFNRMMNVVGQFILKRATAVRAVSGRLKLELENKFGIPSERIVSIPIGTDLSIFATAPVSTRTKQILFVGRLLPEKEPLLFAEVATRLLMSHTDFTVGIAGDGVLREALETYFETHGLSSRVTFYGAIDQKTLAPIYAASFCYVHTAGWEGWGMPMIESMAAGCPVVTTDSGCAGEAIRNLETGLVTPVGDTDALVAAVNELLGDPLLWERIVMAGMIEAHTWSAVALSEKLMQWYGQE